MIFYLHHEEKIKKKSCLSVRYINVQFFIYQTIINIQKSFKSINKNINLSYPWN